MCSRLDVWTGVGEVCLPLTPPTHLCDQYNQNLSHAKPRLEMCWNQYWEKKRRYGWLSRPTFGNLNHHAGKQHKTSNAIDNPESGAHPCPHPCQCQCPTCCPHPLLSCRRLWLPMCHKVSLVLTFQRESFVGPKTKDFCPSLCWLPKIKVYHSFQWIVIEGGDQKISSGQY